MTTNIQLLRSSIANKRPDPNVLLEGQAAVNISPASGSAGLYFALTDDSLVKVGPVAFHPISPPNVTPAGHPGNSIGEEWMDTSPNFFQPVEKVYNGSRWLASSGFLVDDNSGDFTLSKTMHLRTMEAHGKAQFSYIRVPQDNYDARRIILGAAGMFRFNNDEQTLKFEGHDGSQWVQFATSGGTSTLEGLVVNGDIESSGNVLLCSDCNDDFRVRGEGLFDCGVSVEGGINVKGNGVIQGENVYLNTNLTDKTYINGGLTTYGDSEFSRSLVVGRLGNTSVFTVNCPSYLLEDTRIGIDSSHKLTVSGVSEFQEYANLRNDVRIGDTISNDLLVNSSARFLGHVQLGDPIGSTNLDVHSTTTFLKDVAFQENVTVGSDNADLLTVKATANFQNDVTVGQQGTDTLQVLAKLVQVSDADFKENVIIGSDQFDELTVNATSVFNASVQLGSEAAQVVHVKATPQFHTNILPSTNLGSSLGEVDTRFGDMHIHNGSATGKLTVHELEVQTTTAFQTDFSVGFDELHDFEVKATTLFKAPVGFERDVFIGDGATDLLTVDATADFNAPVAMFSTLFVEDTVTVNDKVLPNIDNTYTLGSSSLRWQNIYSVNGDFSGTVSIGTLAPLDQLLQCRDLRVLHDTHLGTDDLDDLIVDATLRQHSAAFFDDDVTIGDDAFDELFVNSTANFYANTKIGLVGAIGTTNLDVYSTSYFYSNVYPDADASVDVGSAAQRWKDMYALNAYLTNDLEVGSNCTDNLLVHATSLFKCDSTTEGNVVLNSGAGLTTTINGTLNATSTVNLNSNSSQNTTIAGNLDSQSNVVLNTDCNNTTTIKGTLTGECDTTLNGNLNLAGDAIMEGDVTLNTDCTDTTRINGVLNTFCDVDLCATNTQQATIRGDLDSQVNVVLNSNCGHTTQIKGELFADCDVHLGSDNAGACSTTIEILGEQISRCNVTLNTDCTNTTDIKGVLTADCDVTLNNSSGDTINKGNLTVNKNATVDQDLTVTQKSYLEDRVTCGGNVIPKNNNSVDLGTTSNRWRNIYTNDMHFSNMGGKSNDVDGTNGNWTLQEGKDDLFLINNLTGAKFRISMEPVG